MKVVNKTTPVVSIAPEREEVAGILQTGEEVEYRAEGLNRKIVSVKTGAGGRAECITQYGPYSSAKYRIQPTSKDVLNDPTNEILNISDPSKRIGEMKVGKDFKYDGANVKAILGVALSQTTRNENILDKVDPAKKGKKLHPIAFKISWDETVQRAEGT